MEHRHWKKPSFNHSICDSHCMVTQTIEKLGGCDPWPHPAAEKWLLVKQSTAARNIAWEEAVCLYNWGMKNLMHLDSCLMLVQLSR